MWLHLVGGKQSSMIRCLSILIPTYNYACVELVEELCAQAKAVEGLKYEILVAEDGSTDAATKGTNRLISRQENCRLIACKVNRGRSRIRNFLAEKASFPYLLFLDSDVMPGSEGFLLNYLELGEEVSVAYGGVTLPKDEELAQRNLRYKYETKCLRKFTLARRREHEYQSFRTTNFLVSRATMLRFPFEENIRKYGYEDVLFGKVLEAAGVPIVHLDNAVVIEDFEENADFLLKTEEGLATLASLREKMLGHSVLLAEALSLESGALGWLLRRIFKGSQGWMRRNLTGENPSVFVYNLFRLGTLMKFLEK